MATEPSTPRSYVSATAGANTSVCTFWLDGRAFGIDVALVGEVVTVDTVLPVPRAPAPVRGLFNLRGAPIALLDFVEVLDLDETKGASSPRGMSTALVLRQEDVVVGLVVERVDAVVPPGRGVWTQAAPAEHPAVASFLTLEEPRSVVTVIDPSYLLARLDRIRLQKEVA